MLTKTNVTIEQRGVDERKLFRPEIPFAKERVDGPGGGRGKGRRRIALPDIGAMVTTFSGLLHL